MAVTTQKSALVTLVDNGTGLPGWRKPQEVFQAGMTYVPFDFTQSGAGDQNSTCDLCFLPAGRHRVVGTLSWASWPVMTNGAIRIGHTGYTQSDGTVIGAADAAFLAQTTTTSAGQSQMLAALQFDYDAKAPVRVQLTNNGTGGIADAARIRGHFLVTPTGAV